MVTSSEQLFLPRRASQCDDVIAFGVYTYENVSLHVREC
jgi:hypothetical protein